MTNNDYQVVPETNTLEIQSVKKNHLGSYYCIIHYDGFEKKSEVGILTLKDHSQNKEDNKLSMSVSPPSEIDVILGDRFVLPCLSLKPSATITKWINGTNSNEKNIMLPNNRIKQVGHGSLMVEKAELSDNGLYTCHVSNTNDFEEKSTRVNVRMKPIIIKSLDDEIALETKDIEIHCDAESFPKSKITWYKNGEPIIPSEYFVINYNYLKILGLVKDDQGVYQCVIENDVGSVESHAQIMINTPASLLALAGSSGHPKKPGKPTGLKSLNTGSRFVELIWDLPSGNNQDIVRYHIMYKEIGQNRERTLNTSLTTIVINGLSAETNYVFTVSAENYAGIGEASKPLKITTEKEDSVPGKVRNLFAKASDSESIDVSWEPPLIGGGSTNVSHYNLFYSKKSEDRETRIPMIKTFHTLHGLARNTEYRIRVETEGKNGVGKSSDVLFIKTLSDVPSGRPFNIRVTERFPDSISLSWSGPREDERNGEITGYNIKYKAKKKGSKLKIAHVKGDVQKFQLSRLEGGTQYSIRIAAVNSNGTGPYSEAISAETSFEDKVENQPVGPPIELRVVPSFDRIRVSWKPPIDDSAIIRGYTIGWGINVPDVESAQVDGNIREFTIKNLKPNKEYVVSARAYNNFGAGFPIYETIRTTSYSNSEFNGFGRKSQKNRGSDETYYDDEDESFDSEQKFRKSDESGVPTYVTSETLSATSIKVAWSEENINVFNPEYSVKYFSRSDVNGEVKYVKSNENEVEIEGLRPNTVYEFSVRLVGSTKWSSPSSNKTMSAPPSSAPQDLTIIPPSQDHRGGEPNSVTLNWQPPKYENGEILEYLIYYSEKEDLPDKDWLRDSVKGDKLGLRIFNLKPFTTYYFKVQARNVKGYGPLSRPVSYSINSSHYKDLGSVFGNQDSSLLSPEIMAVIKANFLLIIIGVIVIVVLLLLIILCTIICSNKKSDQKSIPNQNGTLYSTVNNRRQGLVDKDNRDGVSDLWINSSLNHTGREVYCDTPEVTLIESSRMGKNSTESPPPLYQTLHGGTLQRSYHHSSTSLEVGNQRQRTPQIVYTGTNRQPIAKIDFTSTTTASDMGSNFSGSTTALPIHTPPPQGDVTYAGSNASKRSCGNLRSFTHISNIGLSYVNNQQAKTAHIVRPLPTSNSPVAASTPVVPNNGSPSIIKAYSSSSHSSVPVGRAPAQPRINMANIYTPISPVKSSHGDLLGLGGSGGGIETDSRYSDTTLGLNNSSNYNHLNGLQASNSFEEINSEMESLNTMILDIRALHHEFNESM